MVSTTTSVCDLVRGDNSPNSNSFKILVELPVLYVIVDVMF